MADFLKFRLAVTLLAVLMASVLLAPTAAAQSAADTLAVVGHAPPPVANATATVAGTGGFSTYYYWIVARYGGGSVFPIGPAMVGNAAATIAAPTSISVNWTPVNGLNVVYDVLRTTTVQFPQTGYCTCAVALGLTGTSFVDTITTPVLYTNGGFPYQNTIGVVYENVRDYAPPHMEFSTTSGFVSWLSAVAFAAGVDVSGGNLTVDLGNLVVALGNIVATAGNVSAGGIVTGGTGVTAATGNVSATTGNLGSGSLAAESLANGALTAGTGWAVTGDFALAGGTAVYTDSTHTGTLKQVVASQATPALANQRYRFQYDVTANTMINGVVTITTSYAATAKILDMTVGTSKIAYFTSAAAPTDFIISVTGSTGGAFTLDNLSLMATIGGNITAVGRLNGIAGGDGINVDTNGNVHMAGLIVNYGGLPTAGRGIAVIRATFTKTGGTTSIAAQNLMTAAPAGFYKADVYTQVTTQSTGACTATVALGWTYNSQSETANVINAFSLATNNVESDGTQRMVVDASTNITLANTIAGGGCTSQVWDLYVVLERLN